MLANFLNEGGWCTEEFANALLAHQVTTYEFQNGASQPFPHPESELRFQTLPRVAGEVRYMALRRLVEAAVYQREEWRNIYYPDAAGSLSEYIASFETQRLNRNDLAAHYDRHHRNWTYPEQRLLRSGAIIMRLQQAVDAGTLDYPTFRFIRASLVPVQGQFAWTKASDMEQILYERINGEGLTASDIPHITILHPSQDLRSLEEEAKVFSGLLSNAWRFEDDERQRADELEQARKAYAKFTGGKSHFCSLV